MQIVQSVKRTGSAQREPRHEAVTKESAEMKYSKLVYGLITLLIIFSLAVPVWSTVVRASSEAEPPGGQDLQISGGSQFGIPLKTGWNLISLPLIADNSDMESLLSDILDDVISVWYYNAATETWLSYAPGAPSDLATMEDGKAYWLRMRADATLMVDGSESPPGAAYPVYEGWNMVGFTSSTEMLDSDYLYDFTPSEDYGTIYGWNAAAQNWIVQTPGAGTLVPGEGYWIPFAEYGTIYPPTA